MGRGERGAAADAVLTIRSSGKAREKFIFA